jgi:hypothetical protein
MEERNEGITAERGFHSLERGGKGWRASDIVRLSSSRSAASLFQWEKAFQGSRDCTVAGAGLKLERHFLAICPLPRIANGRSIRDFQARFEIDEERIASGGIDAQFNGIPQSNARQNRAES